MASSSVRPPEGPLQPRRRRRLEFCFSQEPRILPQFYRFIKLRLGSAKWWRGILSCCWTKSEAEAEAKAEGSLGALANCSGADEADHLIVTVNGLSGGPNDWRYAAEQFQERFPNQVSVHRSQSNTSRLTHDGVDIMGERLAEEIRLVVKERRNLQKISIVAHSLGGLVARYAIGRLYEPMEGVESSQSNADSIVKCQGKIAGLEPVNFITSGTPHLGMRGRKQLPILCGIPLLEITAVRIAHLIIGRTGNHLYLTDTKDENLPLLVRMVKDCEEVKFISALHSFKRRVAYANSAYDYIVGWGTSSIRRQHELPKIPQSVQHKKYPHVVCVDKGDEETPEKGILINSDQTDDFEEMMIRGLTQVTWERVDVRFHKRCLKYDAHDTIQVRRRVDSDGKDVICHMIDHFQL